VDAVTVPDITSDEFFADRYPTYRTLRDYHPRFSTEIDGEHSIMLTRYADVDEALRNPLITVQPEPGEFPDERIGSGPAAVYYREAFVNIDPPVHTRIRKIATPSMTPRAVAAMRGWVEEIVERNLAMIEGESRVDFAAVFNSITAEVSSRLVHAPAADAHMLLSKAHELLAIVGVSSMSSGALDIADAAGRFYYDYFEDLVQDLKHRQLPADDIVSLLLEAEGREDGVTHTELLTTLIGFLIAGHHTTQAGMTNGTLAFLRHPDQKALLVENPDLARSAWEEILRYDGPVHFRHRYASQPVTIGGEPIEPGQRLLLGLQPANRDERQFLEPDRFKIDRPNNRHLALAAGPHFCIGVQLARLEGEIVFSRLFRRFPKMSVNSVQLLPIRDLSFPMIQHLYIDLT
jgi:cytochrome P450